MSLPFFLELVPGLKEIFLAFLIESSEKKGKLKLAVYRNYRLPEVTSEAVHDNL